MQSSTKEKKVIGNYLIVSEKFFYHKVRSWCCYNYICIAFFSKSISVILSEKKIKLKKFFCLELFSYEYFHLKMPVQF